MKFLYDFSIHLLLFALQTASLLGNTKAKKWLQGRENLFEKLEDQIASSRLTTSKLFWVHCSSLGEFEQGRPLMERLKTVMPECRILLTFFSPSGYEIRKNYLGADFVFYLPADLKKNAERFVRIVKPDMVFFIKYEFWYNFLDQLATNNIPHYLIAGTFRNNQYFFKWHGNWARERLKNFTHLFLQSKDSFNHLSKFGITNASVSGDTRFDRVYDVSKNAREIDSVSQFCLGEKVIVAGSTWAEDEFILAGSFQHMLNVKLILAPHEIEQKNMLRVKELFGGHAVCFSENNTPTQLEDQIKNCLIIDNIGMLSSLYRYAKIAYIGGGFGSGIHNILEAAVFGVPVIFGPNYHKFREAEELISLGGAFSIRSEKELSDCVGKLLSNETFLAITSKICFNYVNKNRGAVDRIINGLNL